MLLHFFVHRRKSCTFVPSKTERFMDRIRLKDKEFELFIPESDIQAAIAKMAVQIKADVEGKNPLFVGVLNGAFMFVAELMRELDVPYELTFARYSSYQGTSSTGILNEIMPVQADIRGRMVILLEDIIDTGFTINSSSTSSARKNCFFNDTATTEIYTLSLHDALPIWRSFGARVPPM